MKSTTCDWKKNEGGHEARDENRKFSTSNAGIIKWDPIWGDQTMQMYGKYEGFPLIVHCLGW